MSSSVQFKSSKSRSFRPLQLRCIPGLLSQTISPTVHNPSQIHKQDETQPVSPPCVAATLPPQQESLTEALPKILLVSSAAAMGSALILCNTLAPEMVMSWDLVAAMKYNIPISAACAALGDMVAQVVANRGTKKPLKLDAKRLLTAGGIAGALQGIGTTVWLAHFNQMIPGSWVGFGSISEVLTLGVKVVVDSFVWGTLLNTGSVLLRRTCAGDSFVEATRKWKDSIVSITAFEFKFWPVWGAAVYAYVPVADQVGAFAVGGFLWSIYLSMIANGSSGGSMVPRKLAWYGRPVGIRRNSASGGNFSAGGLSTSGVVLACSGSKCKVQKNKYIAAKVASNPKDSARRSRPTYQLLRNDKQARLTGMPRARHNQALTL